MIDLGALDRMLDEALAKETPESLKAWLSDLRKDDAVSNTIDEFLKINKSNAIRLQLIELEQKQKELNSQLELLEKENWISELSSFVGKYYKKTVNGSDRIKEADYYYVYGIDFISYKLKTISSWYYVNSDHFQITMDELFNPLEDYDETYIIEEVTKEEYFEHFDFLQKRINNHFK